MAVKTKLIHTLDQNSGRQPHARNVHYIKIAKSNRKGAAETIGGKLHDHLGHPMGDFHIELTTMVNRKEKTLTLEPGDIVFRTNASKRWQALTKKGFKKRFPLAKIG
jgi:hypothetical protein